MSAEYPWPAGVPRSLGERPATAGPPCLGAPWPLAKRLRSLAESMRERPRSHDGMAPALPALFDEAAAEIERLTAALAATP